MYIVDIECNYIHVYKNLCSDKTDGIRLFQSSQSIYGTVKSYNETHFADVIIIFQEHLTGGILFFKEICIISPCRMEFGGGGFLVNIVIPTVYSWLLQHWLVV